MHRFKNLLATALLASLGALSSGCTDATTSVFVQRVIIPEADETLCTWDADGSGLGLIEGKMDVALTSTYTAVLAVGNQLISRADEATFRPESNRVQFYRAEVATYNFAGELMSTFSVPSTGFADPATGGAATYGAVTAVLVDGATAQQFIDGVQVSGQTIVSEVVVKGVTLGGVEVETAPWQFPIVINNALDGNDVICSEPAACDDDIPFDCALGQDFFPDCRSAEAAISKRFPDVDATNISSCP